MEALQELSAAPRSGRGRRRLDNRHMFRWVLLSTGNTFAWPEISSTKVGTRVDGRGRLGIAVCLI